MQLLLLSLFIVPRFIRSGLAAGVRFSVCCLLGPGDIGLVLPLLGSGDIGLVLPLLGSGDIGSVLAACLGLAI